MMELQAKRRFVSLYETAIDIIAMQHDADE